MKNMRLAGTVMAVLAVVLMVGAAAWAVQDDKPAAEGKVAAYEAGKSICVEVEKEKKEFKINAETKVEGDVAVGHEVKVWAKEGTATKIVGPEKKN